MNRIDQDGCCPHLVDDGQDHEQRNQPSTNLPKPTQRPDRKEVPHFFTLTLPSPLLISLREAGEKR
jgi:hypothetical protein